VIKVKSAILLVKKGPYGNMLGFETARFAKDLKTRGNVDVHVVAMDDGVFFYLENQQSQEIGTPPFSIVIQNTAKAGIPLYAVKESLEERNITKEDFDPTWEIKIITREKLAQMISSSDSVMGL
jgi:sulfur relay (sulfurtransferase) DsrF/TusC family protein